MEFIPSVMRNLIPVSILDRLGYNFIFQTGKVNLYQESSLIDNGTLCGNLYILELYSLLFVSPAIDTISSIKHLKLNENYSTLCHKCLSHISK